LVLIIYQDSNQLNYNARAIHSEQPLMEQVI